MSQAIITNAGRAYFASKAGAQEPAIINRFLLCDVNGLDVSGEPNPDETIPDTAFRVRETDVTRSAYVNNNQVVYSLFLGTQEGDYTFNWVGLLSDDGVLVAVRYIDPYTKRASANGEIGNQITRNFLIAYTDAKNILNVTVDAATWQFNFNVASEDHAGMVERATLSELLNGVDDERYVSPNALSKWVVDDVSSTSISRPLSARQGKDLHENINEIKEDISAIEDSAASLKHHVDLAVQDASILTSDVRDLEDYSNTVRSKLSSVDDAFSGLLDDMFSLRDGVDNVGRFASGVSQRVTNLERSAPEHSVLRSEIRISSTVNSNFLGMSIEGDVIYFIKGYVRIVEANLSGVKLLLNTSGANFDTVFRSISFTVLQDSSISGAPESTRQSIGSASLNILPQHTTQASFAIAFEGVMRIDVISASGGVNFNVGAACSVSGSSVVIGSGSFFTATKIG